MFNSLLRACLALTAALQIGRSFSSLCLWLALYYSTSFRLGWTGASLCSAHSMRDSRIATLFDPLQFLAPYTIRAKMALQEAWLRGLDWDEEFPDDLKASTRQWIEQLSEAPKVKIPRCYRHDEEVEQVSLHTFVDASRLSCAAVTYAR